MNRASDPVVVRYWEKKRQICESDLDDRSGPANLEKRLEKFVPDRRGVAGTARTAYEDAFKFIAVGMREVGLELARCAIRYAELALEIGDIGVYPDNPGPPPRELGLAELALSRYYGKWLLGDESADIELLRCLEFRKAFWEPLPPDVQRVTDRFDLKIVFSDMVIPHLQAGRLEEAACWYRTLAPQIRIDPEDIAANASDLAPYLAALMSWLQGGGVSEDQARRTSEEFHYNLAGWGHHAASHRGGLCDYLLPTEHVQLAQIRAQYFTHESDPIAIVQSIRGCPV